MEQIDDIVVRLNLKDEEWNVKIENNTSMALLADGLEALVYAMIGSGDGVEIKAVEYKAEKDEPIKLRFNDNSPAD